MQRRQLGGNLAGTLAGLAIPFTLALGSKVAQHLIGPDNKAADVPPKGRPKPGTGKGSILPWLDMAAPAGRRRRATMAGGSGIGSPAPFDTAFGASNDNMIAEGMYGNYGNGFIGEGGAPRVAGKKQQVQKKKKPAAAKRPVAAKKKAAVKRAATAAF